MHVYTVHMPSTAAEAPQPAAVRLVREGFAWGAFFLGPVWLLAHRLWAAALSWLVLAALAIAGAALGLYGTLTLAGLIFLLCLLSGLEGNEARRQKLYRAGADLRGIVTAGDLESAEYRVLGALHRLVPRRSQPVPAISSVPSAYSPPLVGLFPIEEERP